MSVEAEHGDAIEEGRAALRAGDPASARAWFQQILDADPLSETFPELDGAARDVDAESDAIADPHHAELYDIARARLWLGFALIAFERADEAEREAIAAAQLFRPIHAESGQRAAAELLDVARRLSPSPRPIESMRGPVETSPLSSREVEILRLVSLGLSNHAIAQRLVLSDHTIHRHVANILTKLGVSTRTAAVGVAARGGLL